ncbi:MAG: AtpZ/AtpI family protein [Opitutales bacterium]
MNEYRNIPPKHRSTLAGQVGPKAARKLKARGNPSPGVWSGLGMMGLIGWSVSVPTLLGAGLGIWLDRKFPGGRSWTLALLVAGLVMGCMNAWHWVSKEDAAMREEQEGHEDE